MPGFLSEAVDSKHSNIARHESKYDRKNTVFRESIPRFLGSRLQLVLVE
jgi:hypothetical protein